MSQRKHVVQTAFVAFALVGCSSTIGPPDGAAERSREIVTLKQANRALRAQLADLDAVHATEPDGAVVDPRSPLLPRPAELTLATGSAIRGGVSPSATIRLSTVDAHGRFVQVTGPVSIVLAAISPDGEAIRVAQTSVDPTALRASLRGGFMGTAYSIEVPLEKDLDLPPVGGNVLVRVLLEDIRLDAPLKVETLVPVLPPHRSSGVAP